MTKRTLMCAAAAAVTVAGLAMTTAAHAQTAPVDGDACFSNVNNTASDIRPRACVNVQSGGAANNTAAIVNGRQANNLTAGTGSTSWSNGGWTDAAAATGQNASVSRASSDLTTGQVRGYISRTNTTGGGGDFNARISDYLTFNNTSGSAITLSLGYAFDGAFSRFGNTLDGLNNGVLLFYMRNNPTNTAGYGNVVFAASNQILNSGLQANFDAQTGYFNQNSQAGGTPADYTFTGGFSGGYVTGGATTNVIIPTGISQLGFSLTLNVLCTSTNIVCDFGNTSAFQLGALPSGLTYTSGSGVLFSANATPGVPEPATWATMILGFGMVGGALRRRRTTAPALA